ncbi:preprotein translocase subunit SecE [Dehalococcoidales bacterium]|nr:preprotein translocase subunit SecE [Dehalococcoidales bacterium]MCL0091765.1 preprotein translocase subunit SecE [Dehalococcoidales bacterium]
MNKKGSRFRFIGETIAELKKAVWLTKPEVVYLTFVVLVFSIIAGLVLGVFDYSFTYLTELFLGQRG